MCTAASVDAYHEWLALLSVPGCHGHAEHLGPVLHAADIVGVALAAVPRTEVLIRGLVAGDEVAVQAPQPSHKPATAGPLPLKPLLRVMQSRGSCTRPELLPAVCADFRLSRKWLTRQHG